MDIATQPVSAGQSPSPVATAPASDAERASTEFETFLKLLTAQLRNQDPLQPVDSTQFVAQLASFSSVEQQVKTNVLLRELTASLAGSAPERLVGLIGHEVPVPVAVTYNDAPVDILFHPVTGASEATLVIRDAAGATVGRLPIDPANGTIAWDGVISAGSATTGAAYTFEIESASAGTVLDAQPGLVFTPVTQIRFDTHDPKLGFADGSEIALSEVLQVRASGS